MTTNNFYVYEHWRPDKNECFYVGKGRTGRGSRANNFHHRNKWHLAINAKLIRAGLSIEVRFVAERLSEDDAFHLEIERIAHWRSLGVMLSNITDGGEGFSGGRHSTESKGKISDRLKGRIYSPDTLAKMSAGQKRRAETTDVIEKLTAYHVGRVHSKEEKLKRANSIRKARYVDDNAQHQLFNI